MPAEMHPTMQEAHRVLEALDGDAIAPLLAPDVVFRPPTYWAEWHGRDPVAAVLGHVTQVFEGFYYRRIWADHPNYAFEFVTKVEGLDAVGVDLITLNDDGLISEFEVVMRPYKTVGVLREKMMERTKSDARFAQWAAAKG
jgi:hypothetical protein